MTMDIVLPDELWTSSQAARTLGISEETILRMTSRGELPGAIKTRFGGKGQWRFNADEIRRLKRRLEDDQAWCETAMTVAQVADYLKIDAESVRRLARQGRLTGRKIGLHLHPKGDRWMFDRTAIRNLLDQEGNHA